MFGFSVEEMLSDEPIKEVEKEKDNIESKGDDLLEKYHKER